MLIGSIDVKYPFQSLIVSVLIFDSVSFYFYQCVILVYEIVSFKLVLSLLEEILFYH